MNKLQWGNRLIIINKYSTAVKDSKNRHNSKLYNSNNGSPHKSASRGSRKSLFSEGGKTISGYPNESLVDMRKNRSILQNDRVLLSNRITMLRKEEDRLMKKIKDTRDKAQSIIEVKKRNEQRFQERQEKEEIEKMKEEVKRRQRVLANKKKKQEFERRREKSLEDKKLAYQELRIQRNFAVKHKSKVREMAVKQNQVKRNIIKAQENKIHDKLAK